MKIGSLYRSYKEIFTEVITIIVNFEHNILQYV